jgi:hypothetical protein
MAKTQPADAPIVDVPAPSPEPESIAASLAGATLTPEHVRAAAASGHSAVHLLAHAVSQIEDVTATLRQLISSMPIYDKNVDKFNELISRLV